MLANLKHEASVSMPESKPYKPPHSFSLHVGEMCNLGARTAHATAKKLTFKDEGKLRELAQRGEAWLT
jgi:hypothetical protein